jgi:hypothetical protein
MSARATEALKQLISDAFKNVKKGNGIGVREANAIGAGEKSEARAKARAQDTEENWRDLPKDYDSLEDALSSTDAEGLRFLLPHYMTQAIDNREVGWDLAQAVYFKLCFVLPGKELPELQTPAWLDYLRQIFPRNLAMHYGLTPMQTKAIGLFLAWMIQGEGGLPEIDASLKKLEKDITQEENRILCEWATLGGVDIK